MPLAMPSISGSGSGSGSGGSRWSSAGTTAQPRTTTEPPTTWDPTWIQPPTNGSPTPNVQRPTPFPNDMISQAGQIQRDQTTANNLTQTQLAILQRAYGNQAAPTFAGIQGSIDLANARLPAVGANFVEQSSALNRGHAADLALLGLGRGDTNTRLAANARQPAYINALRGQDLRSLGLDMDRLNMTARRDQRLTKSDATARGAWNAPGLERNLTDINEALFNSASQVNINREGVNTRADEQIASAADQRQMLEREASSYGIRADQLEAQLSAGLARLNLDHSMSVLDVMQMVNSGHVDMANLGRSILDQSINTLYQGTQQGTLPDLIAMLGGGSSPGGAGTRTGGAYTSGRQGPQ